MQNEDNRYSDIHNEEDKQIYEDDDQMINAQRLDPNEQRYPETDYGHTEPEYEPTQTDANQHLNNSLPEDPKPPINSENLKYICVRVSFPTATEGTITNYMAYKVIYVCKEKEYTITRRCSDFTALRESLRRYWPCHYIFPAHKKQTIVILLGKPEEGFLD